MTKILLIFVPKSNTPFRETISHQMLLRIKEILIQENYTVFLHKYTPSQIGTLIQKITPDIIFNMVYGYVSVSDSILESQVDTLERIESFNPKSILGSDSKIQRLVQDKLLCSQFLSERGFAVPYHFNLDQIYTDKQYKYLLVKPRFGACHRDIKLIKSSEIRNIDKHEQLLVQGYIDGPEFTVGIVEKKGKVTALLPLEILFHPSETKHILGLNRKDVVCKIDLADRYSLRELAEQIFTALHLKHYARMDFRVGSDGPICIDINPMPNLDPERSFLPIIADLSGINYESLMKILIEAVILRE